ncbi:MAG: PAS domain-containing protein [Nitrospirae bacterium]|nr:MAG: PAS domain-containing protein [Nitrospirota bacterium]
MPSPPALLYLTTPMFSYELLINNLGESVMLFDTKARLVFVNKAGEEFLGKGLKELKDKKAGELFPESRVISSLIKKTLDEGRFFDLRETAVDVGRNANADIRVTPYYGADRLEGAVLSIRENLELSEKEDYQFDSLLYLIGSVAHEIKNPLSGIKGAAQILKKTAKDAGEGECISMILKETERLNSVLSSYLTMTRKPVFNSVNVHEVLEHAFKIMGAAIKEKKVQTVRFYDPSLPMISGDESKLLQVFINLIKNSVEAMSSSKVRKLEVSTSLSNEYMVIYSEQKGLPQESKKQRWVVVRLKDTGRGIPAGEIKKVFLPYYTDKEGGSGFGLAVSKKIIKDHGGLLKLKSEIGEGTSMNVYLPFRETKA